MNTKTSFKTKLLIALLPIAMCPVVALAQTTIDKIEEFRGQGYPKDKALRDRWFDMALACEASPAYQRAAKACVPGTAGRAKD